MKVSTYLSSATFEIERWSVSLVIKFREGTSGGHTDISRYFQVNFHKYLGIVGTVLFFVKKPLPQTLAANHKELQSCKLRVFNDAHVT